MMPPETPTSDSFLNRNKDDTLRWQTADLKKKGAYYSAVGLDLLLLSTLFQSVL